VCVCVCVYVQKPKRKRDEKTRRELIKAKKRKNAQRREREEERGTLRAIRRALTRTLDVRHTDRARIVNPRFEAQSAHAARGCSRAKNRAGEGGRMCTRALIWIRLVGGQPTDCTFFEIQKSYEISRAPGETFNAPRSGIAGPRYLPLPSCAGCTPACTRARRYA